MNRLLFLYIQGYSNFDDISMNFSNEFEVQFADDIITVKKKENFVSGLFGINVIDVNILAGENGIGKSTFAKLIADMARARDMYYESYDYKFIIVKQISSKEIHINSTLDEEIISVKGPADFEILTEHDATYQSGRPIVYYSPFLDFNLLEIFSNKSDHNIIDLSATQVIMNDFENMENDLGSDFDVEAGNLLRHKFSNIRRHLSFIKTYSFKPPFDLPISFTLSFHRLRTVRDDISSDGNKIFDHLESSAADFFRGYPKNQISNVQMGKLMFLRNLLTLYFKAFNNNKSQAILRYKFKEIDIASILNFESENPEDLIGAFLQFFDTQDLFDKEVFMNLIHIAWSAIKDDNLSFRNGNNLLSIELSLDSDLIEVVFSLLSYKRVTQEQRNFAASLASFISFDWVGLSSGEKMFLDLYSRLITIKNDLGKQDETILMIIDEGEMGFHPKWQIEYVTNITEFFTNHLSEYEFQIILATHSPLVLSDFPRERVHLLKRTINGRTKQNTLGTFAQSTTELLASDFFIDTALIGNLAKAYVNQILEDIDNLPSGNIKGKTFEKLSKRICLIDDSVIRSLLQAKLDRRAND